jgi:hypothetical protein
MTALLHATKATTQHRLMVLAGDRPRAFWTAKNLIKPS